MNLFNQLNAIDQYLNTRRFQESEDVLLASGGGVAGGLNFSANHNPHVPWAQHAPWSWSNDTDQDGLCDALDEYNGSHTAGGY